MRWTGTAHYPLIVQLNTPVAANPMPTTPHRLRRSHKLPPQPPHHLSVYSYASHPRYNCTYNALEDWEKSGAYFYTTNMQYMTDILANPVPHFDISWTTRFNAFVPQDDPLNYLMPDSPMPNSTFDTDNEGEA